MKISRVFDFSSLWEKIRLPITLLILVFVIGAIGYKILYPNEPWVRLLLMTSITITTVGFGDILDVEHNPVASWYTMGLMVMGMGVFLYSVSSLTAFFIEGKIGEMILLNHIKRKIFHMKNHIIICGAGQTGIHVIEEMFLSKKDIIVIDNDNEKLEILRENYPGILTIYGDSTEDETLEEANIKNADGLIATLSNDKDNLFLTITARLLNRKMIIISKAIEMSMHKKLKNAGSTSVVSPNFVGGRRMANELLRPNAISFLEKVLTSKGQPMRIESVVINKESSFINKTLFDSEIFAMTGLIIIAYSKDGKEEHLEYNPGKKTKLNENGVLYFIGNQDQKKSLHRLVNHK